VYGQEIADRVFGDTRTESAVQTRLQDRINAQALDQITRQGFTRKCDLINVDVLEEQKAFARWRSQHPEYRYGAPTRDHRHRFTLDDQRWIITDDNKE
jgi:mannosyltransferase OCH1-like enzyme